MLIFFILLLLENFFSSLSICVVEMGKYISKLCNSLK